MKNTETAKQENTNDYNLEISSNSARALTLKLTIRAYGG